MTENRNSGVRTTLPQGIHALIVSGETQRAAIDTMLQSWDIQSDIATSCEQALALSHHPATPFNLLLIDSQFRHSAGFDALLAKYRNVPSIVLRPLQPRREDGNRDLNGQGIQPLQPWDLLSAIYRAVVLKEAAEPLCPKTTPMNVPPALAPLIPKYLDGRQKDLEALQTALEQGDFEIITRVGHNLKGTGAPYGFPEITAIGGSLERAGKDRNPGEAARFLGQLTNYLIAVNATLDSPAPAGENPAAGRP